MENQQTKKKMKNGKSQIALIVIGIIIAIGAIGNANDSTDVTTSTSVETSANSSINNTESKQKATEKKTEATTEAPTEKETEPVNTVKITSLEHGDLEDVIEVEGENAITIKAKISPSYNNKATIDQNYFNVADIICNQGCENYSRIDYWAVADMVGGGEAKVISFTLETDAIQKIYNKQIAETQIGDYVSELWIHQSLIE